MYKNIEEFLKDKDNSARLVDGCRWLYWDEVKGQWIVQSRTSGQKRNRCQYSGNSILEALDELRKANYGI